MNYQVLARKWRPQRFTEVVGQQHVLTALVNALAQGRLHHAYLFSGTRGVGKTSIARLLAKALNCDKGITPEPCGVCSSCVEIEQGRFVDLLEIDAASRTKVEDTRELLDNVQYQPARGRFKVYLIDEVHMLSRHSFNALLKTLEEPPPHVKFLLATTDPQKLPITILSRCLQFHLKSLAPEQIDGQLQHILREEQVPFETEATAALARAADGSVRDALSLTDQALAFGNGEVKLAQVESMLGNLNHNQLMNLVNGLLSGDGAAMLAQVQELASMGPDYDHIHKELIGFWHQLALAQIVPAQPLLPYANELNRLAPLMSPEQIQLYYQICLQGRKDLPFAADGRAALEMTLLRSLAFQPKAVTNAGISADKNASTRSGVTPNTIVEAPVVKKPEPPRIAPSSISQPVPVDSIQSMAQQASPVADQRPAVEQGATIDADADETDAQMAAQLYHEQDTILTQATQFGYEPKVTVQKIGASQEAAAAASAEPTRRLTSDAIHHEQANVEQTSVEPAPAFEASEHGAPVNTAAPLSNAAIELPAHSGSTLEALDTPETAVTDPAAANVAQIRRLLQTRNRLRSQDVDDSVTANQASRLAQASYTPPTGSVMSQNETASSVAAQASQHPAAQGLAQQGLMQPLSVHKESAHQESAPQERSPFTSQYQGAELPPLDAYADMGAPADDDDLPPWLDDATASFGSSSHSLPQSSPHSSREAATPASVPAPAPVSKQTASSTAAVASGGGLSAMTGLRSPAAQASSDPEPLKPSSLLAQASDAWTALVAQLPLGGLLRQLAMHSSLEQQSASQWQLWLKPEHKHLLNDKARDELAAVLSEQQQTAISLQVQVGEQPDSLTPFEIEQQLYQAAIVQAKDEIAADDAVQFLISRFAAQLDSDSIEPMAQ